MTGRHRRHRRPAAFALAGALMSAVALGACATDSADSFAEDYTAYLRGRSDVTSFRVHPNNAVLSRGSVDTVVSLRAGLPDEDVARAARELAAHRGGAVIDEHRIRVEFSARDSSGGPVAAEIYLVPGSDNPRLGDPARYLDWVRRTRQFTASNPGVTAVRAWRTAIAAESSRDAYPLAESLDRFVADDSGGIRELSVTGSDCVLQWDAGDAPAELGRYRDLLALLPAGTSPVHCRATSQRPEPAAAVYLTVSRTTPDTVVESIRARAAEIGLPAQIAVAA
ncbi:hypothetical protein [Gordonia sihwensis]|uniref:hypothetical protein n=1 Tax=Gordonia sihwensis TaxID=173559 RepID=UPI0005ED65C1|nr:hypothetical protein [Gordonia sihwensis]KJR05146.1 hypothetical protein UG54_17400 [Gordonia sihwensis]